MPVRLEKALPFLREEVLGPLGGVFSWEQPQESVGSILSAHPGGSPPGFPTSMFGLERDGVSPEGVGEQAFYGGCAKSTWLGSST